MDKTKQPKSGKVPPNYPGYQADQPTKDDDAKSTPWDIGRSSGGSSGDSLGVPYGP